jgi:hypothetical protein
MAKYRSASALVGVGALVAVLLALTITYRSAGPEEKLAKKAAAKPTEQDAATERAIHKIQKKMMKSLHMGDEKKKPTREHQIRDRILNVESKIGKIKLSTSNLFAKWEKERTIAKDAKTKAVSLNELIKQQKTKERMEEQTLENLKAKLGNQLETQIKKPAAAKKKVFTQSVARNDLDKYFAKLDKQDKMKNVVEHSKSKKVVTSAVTSTKVETKTNEKPAAHKPVKEAKADSRKLLFSLRVRPF